MAEDPVFENSLATQGGQPWNKECQRSQRDQTYDDHKDDGWHLKGHQVRTVEKLLTPRRSDDSGGSE